MPIIVAQGQNVRVNGIGQGFSVSTEGQALTNAVEGELVKVRVPNGTIISGIAKNNGQIEVIIRQEAKVFPELTVGEMASTFVLHKWLDQNQSEYYED